MVFSSLNFLSVFLPIVLLVYFIAPRKFKNLVLFVSSLIFYAWGEPIYVLIMMFSILINYLSGLVIAKCRENDNDKGAKITLIVSVVVNLGILGLFKYSDFLISNVNSVFNTSIPLLKLVLPIGISFYTFQTMSYTIDVYRKIVKAQKNIISFGTYVVLFPQLIAGPIVQYKTIAEQLDSRKETRDDFTYGVTRFMTGLGKKVLFANNIGALWNTVSAMDISKMPALTAWLGIIAFTFQIYFDFSGYSDMAIGMGRMFGFSFLENFNYPYMAKSITEFWRRWHISLGTWFREYVYIPLGGNRHGFAKQIRNIAIVWLLTGIWHGASWNFLLWGLYFGVILVFEKLFLLKRLEKAPVFISRFYTMFLVICSWVIFAFDDVKKIGPFFKAMFFANGVFDSQSIYLLYTNIIMIVILCFACTDLPKCLVKKIAARFTDGLLTFAIAENIFYAATFILSIAYLVDATYNPFLYFRF